jgi:hypothetical protein
MSAPGLEPPAAFSAPWQLRIYAAAAAAADAGRLDRDVFLARFSEALARATPAGRVSPEQAYACWLAALEDTLRDHGLLDDAELAAELERQAAAQRARDRH